MKFSFIKCAAALLTGALLAVACSKDYEADITRLENKIDQVSSGTGDSSIPGLQAQLKALEALVEQYNTQLKADLASNLQDQTNKYNELLSKYNALDQALKDAKTDLVKAINDANTKIGNLENKDAELSAALQNAINDYNAKINQAISDMRTALAAQAVKDGAQDQAIEGLKNRLDALEIQITKDIAACKTYTNEQIAALKELMETKDAELSSALVAYKAEVKSELDGMKADIQANKESIVTLNAQMDQVKNTEIPAIKAKIEAIELRLHDDENNIQANADAIEALQELTTLNFNTLKGLIDAMETAYKNADQAIKDDVDAKYAEIIARFVANEEDIEANQAKIAQILEILNDEATGYDAIWAAINQLNLVQKGIIADLKVVRDSVNLVDQKYAQAVEDIEAAIDAIKENLNKYQKEGKAYVDSVDKALLDSITRGYEALVAAYTAADDAIRADYDAKIAQAKNHLAEKIHTDSLALGALIDALEGKLNTLQNDFDALSDKVDSICNVKVDTAEFNAFKREVAATYVTNDAFNTFVQAYETTIGEINAAIENLNKATEAIASRLEVLAETLNKIFDRIQSVQFVPTHSDMKMTVNYARLNMADYVAFIPMKTQVTYKVNPENAFVDESTLKELFAAFQNAQDSTVKDFLAFDVKDVETRSYSQLPSETNADLFVTDIVSYNPATGYFVMNVQANGSLLNRGLRTNYPGVLSITNLSTVPWYNYASTNTANEQIVTNAQETLQNKIAVSLEIRKDKAVIKGEAPAAEEGVEVEEGAEVETADKEFNISNIASPFTVLYLNPTAVEIEFGGAVRETGDQVNWGNEATVKIAGLETIPDQLQTLPYNATEAIPAHETVNGKDTTFWYRIILDGAVPAYRINGQLITPEDARKVGFAVPLISKPEEAVFNFFSSSNNRRNNVTVSDTDENLKYFDNDANLYSKVKMSATESAINKRNVIGWYVRGIYNYVVEGMESENLYSVSGDVRIVKPTATMTIYASAKWNYALDAKVDHARAYGYENASDTVFTRTLLAVDSIAKVGNETALAYLERVFGFTPADLLDANTSAATGAVKYPVQGSVTVKDKDMAEGLDYHRTSSSSNHGLPRFMSQTSGTPGATPAILIDAEGNPTADPTKIASVAVSIKEFEFDNQYTYEATYETEPCDLVITFILTTVDRDRTPIVIGIPDQMFAINKAPAASKFNGFTANNGYFAESDELSDPTLNKEIFDAFVAKKIANVDATALDFADLAAFKVGEIADWIKYVEDVPHLHAAYTGEQRENGADSILVVSPSDVDDVFVTTIDEINGATDLEPMRTAGWKASTLKKMATDTVKNADGTVNPYAKISDTLVLRIANYIGQVVELKWRLGYTVPAYDFQHQSNFTFAEEDKWYSMASPKYDYNKQSLKKYDVNYMNVPALCFNIIDENKRIFNYQDENIPADDASYFYDDSLRVNFWYTGIPAETAPVDETPLEEQSVTGQIDTYGELWFNSYDMAQNDDYDVKEAKNFEHAVFYYRSIRDAIPMYGTLELSSGDTRFEIPTSFKGNGYISGNDYSKFELRAWKPFYVPAYEQTLTINLDEHENYFLNILEGVQFFDARQVAASTAVTADTFEGEGVYSIEGFNYGVKSYFRPMFGVNMVEVREEPAGPVGPGQDPGPVGPGPRPAPGDGGPGQQQPNVTYVPVWSWLLGNTEEDGTVAASTADDPIAANGFYTGVYSWQAYDLSVADFGCDKTGIDPQIRRLVQVNGTAEPIEVQLTNGKTVTIPAYSMVFDYNSQMDFQETATVQFAFKFQTPWQQFRQEGFVVNVKIVGLNAQ